MIRVWLFLAFAGLMAWILKGSEGSLTFYPPSEDKMQPPILPKKIINKIKKLLPVPRKPKKYDDITVLMGIIFVIQNGIPWRQLPENYGKWKTVYMRFNRWSKKGIFSKIFILLRSRLKKTNIAMLDSTFIKAHRTAASLKADNEPRNIGRSKGGLTTKIHLLCTENQVPIDFMVTAGQVSDAKVAPVLITANCNYMEHFLADKAYDGNKIRSLCAESGINDCIPPKANRKAKILFDKEMYKKRHVIENIFSRLKDWRGVAMRYCRCAHTYHSFVAIALISLSFFNVDRA